MLRSVGAVALRAFAVVDGTVNADTLIHGVVAAVTEFRSRGGEQASVLRSVRVVALRAFAVLYGRVHRPGPREFVVAAVTEFRSRGGEQAPVLRAVRVVALRAFAVLYGRVHRPGPREFVVAAVAEIRSDCWRGGRDSAEPWGLWHSVHSPSSTGGCIDPVPENSSWH